MSRRSTTLACASALTMSAAGWPTGWTSLWIRSGTVCGNGAIALALAPLRDLGVARDALEPAALAASTSSSMKANPVSLSGEQLLEMLEAAWE
ncbi:Uncharacterised protein [Klebsiella aerogenes]|nr:Uncharacterised protein [Klebsiella aerogenes]